MEAATAFIGIAIRTRQEPINFEQFQNNRLGKYRCVMIIIVLIVLNANFAADFLIRN